MIITRESLNGLFVAYNAAFKSGLGTGPSQYEQVAMVVPSTTSQNVYYWLGDLPNMKEWLGDRVVKNLGTHDYTIKNRSFESTVGVKLTDIEDDTYGVYNPMFEMLGKNAVAHPNQLVFEALAKGHETACFDGQYFFDADHPVGGNSVSNLLAPAADAGAPWFLLCTSAPVKPIIFQKRRDYALVRMDKPEDEHVFMRNEVRYGVDARVNVGYGLWQTALRSTHPLGSAAYEQARQTMLSQKGDDGNPLNVLPDLLVVPPTLEGAARRLLENKTGANGADNEWFGTAKILVCPWLSV